MSEIKELLPEYLEKIKYMTHRDDDLEFYKKKLKNLSCSVEIADIQQMVDGIGKYIKTAMLQLEDCSCNDLPSPEYFEMLEGQDKKSAYPTAKMPQILREAVEVIAEYVQAPVGLAAHTVISAAAHIAQSRVNAAAVFNAPMPCSIFILSLGDSGSRKSSCHSIAFKIIQEAERQAIYGKKRRIINAPAGSTKISGMSVRGFELGPLETVSDVVFEGLVALMIHECSFLTVNSDDAGQWFGGHSLNSPTRLASCAGYTKAFDNGSFERVRALGNATGSGIANDRRLSISLMAQDKAIKKYLLDPMFQAQGLLPRFIFSTSECIAGTRFIKNRDVINSEIDDPRLIRFWERCEKLIAIPSKIDMETGGVVADICLLDGDALDIWTDFYDRVEGRQGANGQYAHMKPFAARAGELSRRLATVFAFFDEKKQVDAEAMQSAIDIVEHSLNEWSKYMLGGGMSEDVVAAGHLMQWFAEKKWRYFTPRTVLQNGPAYIRNKKSRDKLLFILTQHKYLFYLSCAKVFIINPHFLRSETG